MKLLLALLSLITGVRAGYRTHKLSNVKADSKLGMKLLGKARRLDENDDMNANQGYYNGYYYDGDGDFENTWVANMELKFQGCHHISQWNEEADGEDDVRISTKRLVRFRLCPAGTCSTESASGCTEGYGDYIIDMNVFLESWFEAKQTYQEFECEYLEQYVCAAYDGNDYQMYDCYAEHNMQDVCMDENPYNQGNDNEQEQLEIDDYFECAQSEMEDQYGNQYYIGPYCAAQGGAIYLGVFSDESCTNFVDETGGRETYYTYMYMELPYSNTNIVDMDCMSCKEPQENNNDGNDAEDEDEVNEMCETLYAGAGKCEANLPYGTTPFVNNNACNYMEGIKIVRKDGTVVTADAKANKTAAIFIGIFVVAFVLLSAYVYYLKTKLDRASINLAE